MIDLISNFFSEGDFIKLIHSNSSRIVEGYILKIMPKSIALKTLNGSICGIKGDDINSFEEGKLQSLKDFDMNSITKIDEYKIQNCNPSDKATKIEKSRAEETCAISFAETKESHLIKSTLKFKPGDVIPLETLEKIDPTIPRKRLASTVKNKSNKLKTIGKDLSALSSLVEEEHEIENQKIIPANGEIKLFYKERNFGFITDGRSRLDLYFNLSQIIDETLKENLIPFTSVVYTVVHDVQGAKAIGIHKPGKIVDLVILAKKLASGNDFRQAINVLDHILSEYPNNFTADKLKREFSKNIPSYLRKTKEYSNVYFKAKKHHDEKNYEKAIEYYLKAIENDQKVESSIKDLAMLYASLYKSNEKESYRLRAINFMQSHVKKLSSNVSTWYFLENFYYAVRDFENFDRTIDILVEEKLVFKDKNKHSALLAKKAASLIHQKSFDLALDVIEEALSIYPDNQAALKMKTIIENPNTEDIESIISATDFNTLTSGLSSFIEQILEEYDDYYGVPAKIIESGKFNDVTLKEIRNLIETAGKARARERANYLLTEGKLMLDIEPDNVVRLRSVMARYCNAMALNSISNNSSMDITRFYYNEAFSLEERYDATARQVSYYLLTHCHTYVELLNATTKNVSVDNSIEQILAGDFDNRKWESILSMFLYNREISAQITSKLYANQDLKAKAIQALRYFGINSINQDLSKEEFVEAWNKAREIRLGDYKSSIISIKLIGDSHNIEEVTVLLSTLRQNKKTWMCPLDTSRINNIINNIAPAIESYIKSSGYRNKESNYNNANGQIQQLVDEIKDGPTKLSFEAFLPLLNKIKNMLRNSFNDVIKMSEPKITIKLLSSETVVNEDNNVSIQVSISNHKDSSPIREVSVYIQSSDDVEFIQTETKSYNAIDGGEERIFKLRVRVSSVVLKNKATVLETVCKYKSGDTNKKCESQLSLRLYSSDEYRQIPNLYAPIADGGPVPADSNMFYGREEFITNIADSIIKSPSKQVIIYGQKRCGKSSVMLHLKKRLIETGQTFCVFFSIGEIINNLTEATFYYKILSTIQQELDSLEFDGEQNIPTIKLPHWIDFKLEDENNPLNTFIKYMTYFKQTCKQTSGWETKNLVVMIDEFTYLYTEIKKGNVSPSIMKQWKAVTQNERSQFSVVLVGQDVVPSFKKEDYARNAFGVIQDIRLTYLKEEPARDLIEKPILNENGESRYIGNAVSRIIEYTSRNPYYIQIFCARLVDYMNSNKSINVTEADVNEVASSFIQGDQALEEDKFDNLIRAGETQDLQEYAENDILAVLRQIAINSKNIGYCNKLDISILQDDEKENQILKHLVDREVLERKGENNYKIQVKLFQEWLLNH